jgi:sugar lactone lactonase YvrE
MAAKRGADMTAWRVRWLRRGNGKAGCAVMAIAAAGVLVPLTSAAATQAAANPGTLKLSPGHATAGDSADVFVFKYTAPAKPVPGTVSITVPDGFSVPQDTAAAGYGYLSTSSSCASFQISGITTDDGAARVTLAVSCAARGTGTLVYEDVAVPTTAGTYPFAASFTPPGSQSPIAFTAQHSVTVKPGPLASLALSPEAATIASGGSQAYTAQGFDAYGNSRGNITSATKFKISPNGSCTGATCTAAATGPHIVIGTSKKIINTAALTVTTATVSHIYWADYYTGTINEANLDGTSPQTIVTGQAGPSGMAVDSSHIYWTDRDSGTINEANLDGTSPQTIITGQAYPIGPAGVAVDGSHIYWTDVASGTINEANLDGTSPQTIVTGQDYPQEVAVDGSHIYWADYDSGTINEANLDGTDPQTIVTGQDYPVGVAVDSSHLYWANQGNGTINEANLDGTSPQTIITGQANPAGVAVDSSHLYWTNQDGTASGTINEANLDGTSPQTIVTGQDYPYGVAVGP